jgi:hypothetical protein
LNTAEIEFQASAFSLSEQGEEISTFGGLEVEVGATENDSGNLATTDVDRFVGFESLNALAAIVGVDGDDNTAIVTVRQCDVEVLSSGDVLSLGEVESNGVGTIAKIEHGGDDTTVTNSVLAIEVGVSSRDLDGLNANVLFLEVQFQSAAEVLEGQNLVVGLSIHGELSQQNSQLQES